MGKPDVNGGVRQEAHNKSSVRARQFTQVTNTDNSTAMDNSKETSPLRVLIIGAGRSLDLVNHLTCTYWTPRICRLVDGPHLREGNNPPTSISDQDLRNSQAGITATVFEKDESPTARPRDWNFGIYWAQSRLAEIISAELNAQLDSVQTDPSHVRSPDSIVPIYHGVTGELLKALPAPYSIRLQRRAWLDLIRKDVHVQVSFHLPCVSYPKLIRLVWKEPALTHHHADRCHGNIHRRHGRRGDPNYRCGRRPQCDAPIPVLVIAPRG